MGQLGQIAPHFENRIERRAESVEREGRTSIRRSEFFVDQDARDAAEPGPVQFFG